jgi:hypothetical protein
MSKFSSAYGIVRAVSSRRDGYIHSCLHTLVCLEKECKNNCSKIDMFGICEGVNYGTG